MHVIHSADIMKVLICSFVNGIGGG